MRNSIRSENGSTLLMVLGFIVVLSLLAVPLLANSNIGLLQAKTNGNAEIAFTNARSAMQIFEQVYDDLKANQLNTAENIALLTAEIERMHEELHIERVWLMPSEADPEAVMFRAKAGAANQERESTLVFPLKAAVKPDLPTPEPSPGPDPTPEPSPGPDPTPEPTESPQGPPEIATNATVIQSYYPESKMKFDSLFCACGSGKITVDHSYNKDSFRQAFGSYVDYYLNDVLEAQTSQKLGELAGLPGTGLRLAKEVNPAAGIWPAGTTISADGNVSLGNGTKAVQTPGSLEAGGNLTSAAGTTLNISGDLKVQGNVTLGTGGSEGDITVHGDMLVGGDLLIKNSFGTLTVDGNMIVDGNIIFENTVKGVAVGGDLDAMHDIILKNTVTNGIGVGGSLNVKGNMDVQSTPKFIKTGRSLTVGGNLLFRNSINDGIYVQSGDLTVGGKLTISNTINHLVVQGSLLVNGSLTSAITVSELSVANNVITGGDLTFGNRVTAINIGGSLVSGGSLTNDSGIDAIKIGHDLVVNGNFTMNNNINKELKLNGIWMIYGDAAFKAVPYDPSSQADKAVYNQMKRFMVGGLTTFESYLIYYPNIICITE
ncbi:hypothetical protein [Paenibacillus protaetiae]|nr:hypothetical protein [Paenibacillus protaetiae]